MQIIDLLKDSKGSSIKDVDAFFKGKKGIKRKVIETHDDVKQVDYWYVDPDGKKLAIQTHLFLRRNYDKI